jgi:N-methylhydantoinase A
VAGIFTDLEARAGRALAAQGFGPAAQRLVRTADLRYFGQAFEVRVPVAGQAGSAQFDPATADAVANAFHDAHRALYGYDFRGDDRQQVEWVNLRVTGVGPIRRPVLPELPPGDEDADRAKTGTRAVSFGRRAGFAQASLYWRPHLAAGDVVTGPAVIEEYGATVPLHPGFTATVDRFGNLRVTAGR